MAEIRTMIDKTWNDRNEARAIAKANPLARNWAMPWLYATRLHALLDCYAKLGGDVSPWRNKAGVLEWT